MLLVLALASLARDCTLSELLAGVLVGPEVGVFVRVGVADGVLVFVGVFVLVGVTPGIGVFVGV
jgi:hypothetical protein